MSKTKKVLVPHPTNPVVLDVTKDAPFPAVVLTKVGTEEVFSSRDTYTIEDFRPLRQLYDEFPHAYVINAYHQFFLVLDYIPVREVVEGESYAGNPD